MENNVSLLLIPIIVLGAADVWTTVRGINRGGTEINPVARPLFARFGTLPVAVALKAVFYAAVFALAWLYPHPAPLVGIALLQAAIVAYNLSQ